MDRVTDQVSLTGYLLSIIAVIIIILGTSIVVINQTTVALSHARPDEGRGLVIGPDSPPLILKLLMTIVTVQGLIDVGTRLSGDRVEARSPTHS